MRNLEKHDFCDEIGSPGFWGTLKINFRSADAANHFDARPWGEIGMTRRAYIHKI